MRSFSRVAVVLGLTLLLIPTMGSVAFAQLGTDDPGVIVEDGGENCNGIIPTPGSENTVKRLTGGDLNPGGFAEFVIEYPVDAEEVGDDWEIVDCVLIGNGDDLKTFDVLDQKTFNGVVNSTFFTLSLVVDIPADTPVGTSICNVAKTTEGPTAPQASNRKAGPACFVVGGAARVEKQDPEGNLLEGAVFRVHDCESTAPDPSEQPIIISPEPDADGLVTATEGFISFNGPSGSSCLVTEVTPPPGYTLPDPEDRTQTVTIPVGVDSATVFVFVDTPVEPSILVTKSCDPTSVGIGGEVTYTITLENTGTDDLEDITVVDSLLGDISNLFPDTLAVGAAPVVREVTRTVLLDDPDPLVNIVTAQAVGVATDQAVDSEARCESDVLHEPDIDVTKSCVGPVNVGDVVTYTITVENTGNEPLEDVTVEDSLLGDISNLFPDTLDVGQEVSVDVERAVLPGDPDLLENSVTASGTGADSQTTVDDTDVCDVDVLRPLILISKTGPALAHVGDEVTYDMSVTNIGNTPLLDVVVSDPLCDAAPVFTGGDTDADDALDLTETWTFTCSHVITAEDGDPVDNTATVVGSDSLGTEVEASDDHTVDIIHPDITIVKVSDVPIAAPGQTVTFTLTVTNTGDTPLLDVVVTDPLCDSAPELVGGDLDGDSELDLAEVWIYSCTMVFPAGGLPVDNVAAATGTDVLGLTVDDDDTVRVDPILGEIPRTGSSGVNDIALFGGLFLFAGLVLSIGSRKRLPAPAGPDGTSSAPGTVGIHSHVRSSDRAARLWWGDRTGRAGPNRER